MSDIDEVLEEKIWSPGKRVLIRVAHGEIDEKPEIVGMLGDENLLRFPPDLHQTLRLVLLRPFDRAAHNHHPLHRIRMNLRGHTIRHEPAVTDPVDAVTLHAQAFEAFRQALSLEAIGAVPSVGE